MDGFRHIIVKVKSSSDQATSSHLTSGETVNKSSRRCELDQVSHCQVLRRAERPTGSFEVG